MKTRGMVKLVTNTEVRLVLESLDRICSRCLAARTRGEWKLLHHGRRCPTIDSLRVPRATAVSIPKWSGSAMHHPEAVTHVIRTTRRVSWRDVCDYAIGAIFGLAIGSIISWCIL